MYMWGTCGLHVLYMWCTYGVHLVYRHNNEELFRRKVPVMYITSFIWRMYIYGVGGGRGRGEGAEVRFRGKFPGRSKRGYM